MSTDLHLRVNPRVFHEIVARKGGRFVYRPDPRDPRIGCEAIAAAPGVWVVSDPNVFILNTPREIAELFPLPRRHELGMELP